ncbi:hypothetical protein SY83_13470 [Paenibacillus swuensis]|uniref:Uncharacterized protein n=1 Tax=Paenibacillus swuensis TaxID=1178515 RepID=A0A172TJZ9_9BACL|nr:hypothetical protein [Paenibacillus swuensis]ANE47103.1 hypothetical protein SY83_13470 [Paenibacillus swuensis]
MIWTLERPASALPKSYLWTWDHSTNWVLDDPGIINYGCYNRYLKKPETFKEDYRLLTDFAAGLGIPGIVIYGFLRDSHGGEVFAREVAEYAASKGVDIYPGIGLTWYGGPYYEGQHRFNLDTFLDQHPSAKLVNKDSGDGHDPLNYTLLLPDGTAAEDSGIQGICPSDPTYKQWIQDGLQWLFEAFPIGGVNIENGDFIVCHCEICQSHKQNWPAEDPEFFRHQALGYDTALRCLEAIGERKDEQLLNTWATYTGFIPGEGERDNATGFMFCDRPALLDRMESLETIQWTITGMVLKKPLPLTMYLDHGRPEEMFDNPMWPKELKPPIPGGVGLLHQGSQWNASRYDCVVSTIKEGCARAHDSGMEGVVIQGEVSSRHIPSALNYLAFSHFTHWPNDTLRDFGRKTLGQVFHDEAEGEAFVVLFAHWDAGTLTEEHRELLSAKWTALQKLITVGNSETVNDKMDWFRFWHWLHTSITAAKEPHTATFY